MLSKCYFPQNNASALEFREAKFLALLRALIPLAEKVQNDPAHGLVPQEQLVALVVQKYLADFKALEVRYVSYGAGGRGNLIIKYAGTGDGVVSFVGSHMDVVPASAADWQRPPFELVQEGDKLYGRGVTDCLGHVAMLTEMMAQLGERKPHLACSVVVVFICNEEDGSVKGIGVDGLAQNGELEALKRGPMYWVDSADSQPEIACGTCHEWQLEATGHLFHSGMPKEGINALELLHDGVAELQRRFYADFPPHADEPKYRYTVSSTLKPTVQVATNNGVNQVPGRALCKGDLRLTPFWELGDAVRRIEAYVADMNMAIAEGAMSGRGPWSEYKLAHAQGELKLTWIMEPFEGIACDLSSRGFAALCQATQEVLGRCEPVASTGALPLVKDLQRRGFDLQIVGYGLGSTYHANNEYGLLSDFAKGTRILARVIDLLD